MRHRYGTVLSQLNIFEWFTKMLSLESTIAFNFISFSFKYLVKKLSYFSVTETGYLHTMYINLTLWFLL